MTTYTHTLDLEAFYNGDFKTDKEIIILDYSNKYLHRPIQLCILNPKCASVDICKHLRGETPVVENYYVFTRDPGRFGDYKINGFNTNDDYNNSVIDIAKEFLNKDLKRIEVSNTVAVI